jgi:hypothetical protein
VNQVDALNFRLQPITQHGQAVNDLRGNNSSNSQMRLKPGQWSTGNRAEIGCDAYNDPSKLRLKAIPSRPEMIPSKANMEVRLLEALDNLRWKILEKPLRASVQRYLQLQL